jgi:hypothetical protein
VAQELALLGFLLDTVEDAGFAGAHFIPQHRFSRDSF